MINAIFVLVMFLIQSFFLFYIHNRDGGSVTMVGRSCLFFFSIILVPNPALSNFTKANKPKTARSDAKIHLPRTSYYYFMPGKRRVPCAFTFLLPRVNIFIYFS